QSAHAVPNTTINATAHATLARFTRFPADPRPARADCVGRHRHGEYHRTCGMSPPPSRVTRERRTPRRSGPPALRSPAVPTLSEAESKALVAAHGIPVPDERIVPDAPGAVAAADEIGYPVVLK